MDIQEFKKQTLPASPKSKLIAFEREILELHKEGYSFRQIAAFLAQNNCQVSYQGVHYFIKKRLEKVQVAKKALPSLSSVSTNSKPVISEKKDSFNWNELKNIDPQTLI